MNKFDKEGLTSNKVISDVITTSDGQLYLTSDVADSRYMSIDAEVGGGHTVGEQWISFDGTIPVGATITRPEKTEQELEVERLVKAKSERADYVSKIIVEVDDMLFDGDETSQDRMARSIIALNDGETVQWVLADNTIAQVTKEQLREALRKAGTAQTSIWSDPYTK